LVVAAVLMGWLVAVKRARVNVLAGMALGRLGDVSCVVVAFGVDDPAASAGRNA
jgi:hypothetical protein